MASSRVSGARPEQWLLQCREPAFWLGPDQKLVWVNRAWEELTGRAAADVLGRAVQARGPGRPEETDALGGSFYPPPEVSEGRPAAARTLIVHPSGERFWRRVEFWPLHNAKGERTATLGLIRPVSEPSLNGESESQRLRLELIDARERLIGRLGIDGLLGRGPAHRRLTGQVSAAAASRVPVLILGEPGAGKRLTARTVHQLGPHPNAPFVPIDTAALPPEALERTLFGLAYADDSAEHGGASRLGLPDGATLLLGDVLDLPRDLQSRLAGSLGRSPVRLIATASAEPDVALRDERLRPDLYYALTTLVIRLRPLRERLDELPILAQHFVERANARGVRQRSGLTDDALKTLLDYDWPGNLRELARVLDDAHGRGDADLIATEDLPAAVRGQIAAAYPVREVPGTPMPLDELLTLVERRLIENALARARHNKSKAAELLGISRPRLYRRIKELGLPEETGTADEPGHHSEVLD